MQFCLVEFVILHVFISSLYCFFNFNFSSFVSHFLLEIFLNYLFCLLCLPICSTVCF